MNKELTKEEAEEYYNKLWLENNLDLKLITYKTKKWKNTTHLFYCY